MQSTEKKQLKILMLEDSRPDADLVQYKLTASKVNYKFKLIDTAHELEDALENYKPDVILSDHSLPGFNSFEALQICKERNYKGPFILVTGTVSEEFAAESIREGADDYVLKDKLTRLPSAISNALAKKMAERQSEEAQMHLREQNIFLNLLLESLPLAHYLCEADGDYEVTYMAGSIFSFTGFHASVFTEQPTFWRERIHPDDLPTFELHQSELKTKGEVITEYRWKINDGSYKWVYDRAKVIDANHGKKYIAGALIDITSRKESEEKLLCTNKELNTFIYRSTHDLRGPLTSIIGLNNLAQTENDPVQLRAYLKMIGEATQKLDSILLSLINSMSVKHAPSKKEKVDFKSIIDGILKQLSGHDGYSRIKFNVNAEINTNFLSDVRIIESILQNVIENAVKYHGRYEDPRVDISVWEDQGEIVIEVEDNGAGIPEAQQKNVFEMFYRGSSGAKGSGLGLYIVKSGVERLGGTIKLKSSEGKGSRFIIRLPVSDGA
jgi:PAS domain S-box-containing protein